VTISRVEAFHLGSGPDRRFAVLWPADTARPQRGSILFVAPWAEEANKSRRMVAQTARALAAQGWTVLRFDVYGTGDSPGDLADACWEQWVDDLVRAFDWLQERTGNAPVLWAMRAGALLADASRSRLLGASRLLLWQPVTSGKTHLTQFLRLRVAADVIGGGSANTTTRILLEQFQRGQPVEIAGYQVPPAVALALQDAQWRGPWPNAQVDWFEIGLAEAPAVSPAAAIVVEKMRDDGSKVRAVAVQGAPFWQTPELEDCPALVAATVAALT
jgi:uncharacterized protein